MPEEDMSAVSVSYFLPWTSSLNRAWYRHKSWFYRNFRTLVPWTLYLNANLTDVRGTKWIKLESAKPLFSLLLLWLKSSCLKRRVPPFLGSTSTCINYFLAATSPADLHVLGPQWIEPEFQAQVPRNSIKGVVMYCCVKNTNSNSAGKKLAKLCLLCSANIYEHSGGSSALRGKSKSSGQIMFWTFRAKTCFFTQHFKESILFFPQIRMDNWQ